MYEHLSLRSIIQERHYPKYILKDTLKDSILEILPGFKVTSFSLFRGHLSIQKNSY